ncbi:MAG: serine/threonine-protein kinase [Polyangiaceae bacterium]
MTALDELFAGGAQTLGDFRFDPAKKLGQGAYAPVFLADEHHDGAWFRRVALKVFALEPGADAAARRRRILKEAIALSKVKDKNVVKYYSIAEDEARGLIGIAMEYVEGPPLAARLARGPIGAAEVREIGASVARALRAIHGRNLVHRDVKPANIVEAKAGHVLIDFGIAARERVEGPLVDRPGLAAVLADFAQAGAASATIPSDARRTRGATLATAGVTGTLGYIDPMSLSAGANTERAADLYALGATLYECLSGKLPAKAAADASDDPTRAFRAVLLGERAAPPVRAVAPDAPAALARIVDRLLALDPAKRFASAEEVLAALDAPDVLSAPAPRPVLASVADVARELAATQKRLARASRRRVVAGVAGALLLGGAGVGAWRAIDAMEASARRRLDDDWASLVVCLLDEDTPDGAAAKTRFHEISVLWTETSAPKQYLACCEPYAARVDAELSESPKTERLKTALAPFVKGRESVTSEEIEPKVAVLIDAWRASIVGPSFGKPAADVPRPKRIEPLFAADQLAPSAFTFDRSKEGPPLFRSFVTSGEAWLNHCRITREGARCFDPESLPPSMPSLPRPATLPRDARVTQVWDHLLAVDPKKKELVDLTSPGESLAGVDAQGSAPGAILGCKAPKTTWAIARTAASRLLVVSWAANEAPVKRDAGGALATEVGCDEQGLWFQTDAARSWVVCDASAGACRTEAARTEPTVPGVRKVQSCQSPRGDWVAYTKSDIVFAGPADRPAPIFAARGKIETDHDLSLVCGVGLVALVVTFDEKASAIDVTTVP